ncbi:MAG: phospholipase D-like domain-containing protein [Promethearchaeota archaeon]
MNNKKIVEKEIINKEKVKVAWFFQNNVSEDIYNINLSSKVGDSFILSGKDKLLVNKIIEMINEAKEMICICTFIFAEKEITKSLIQVSHKGTRIYILTASDRYLRSLPDEENEFDKKTFAQSKDLFNSLYGKAKIRTSDSFHSKYIIIDPKLETKKGLLLTCNLTTKALIENLEIGVILSKEEIDALFFHFCNGFWLQSQFDYINEEFREINSPFKNYEYRNIRNLLVTSFYEQNIKKSLLKLLNSECKRIDLLTFSISDDNDIFKKLLKKLDEGVEINVLTRPRVKNMIPLIELLNAGAKIYGHPNIHAKGCLIKYDTMIKGIIMTANFEKLGLDKGYETGILIEDERIKDLALIFKNWFQKAPYILKSNLSLQDLNGKIKMWDYHNKDLKDFEIDYCKEIHDLRICNTIEEFLNNEIKLEDMQDKNFKNGNKIFKKIKYKREICPPKLPRNSILINDYDKLNLENKIKKILSKNQFKLFKNRNRLFLVINSLNEYEKAKIITQELNAKIVFD